MRIVVVEDEPKTRRGIINLIKEINCGYEVAGEASNGVEGIKVILRENPDLIFVDIKMPVMNGLEMIEQLKQMGMLMKTVILSGYTDFQYAQKGIKLGIFDYLLKPVTVEDIENILTQINKELVKERMYEEKKTKGTTSAEHALQSLILGKETEYNEIAEYLENVYGIHWNHNIALVLIYLGNETEKSADIVKQVVGSSLQGFKGLRHYIVNMEADNELIVVMPLDTIGSEVERFYQNIVIKELRKNALNGCVLGWLEFEGVLNLKSNLQIIRNEMKWSIILREDVLVSYPKTRQIHTKVIQYPIDIEQRMKTALNSVDIDKIHKYTGEFLSWWGQEVYNPTHVIEAFVRFASSIINTLKNVDYEMYNRINQKESLQMIMNSITWQELKVSMTSLINKINFLEENQGKILSLTVKKALNIMFECYKQGCTLEEVASRLHITPQYLSTVFNKEVGKNFSTYIKEFRINKAKSLLMNTDLKYYQIAQEVGFSDQRYFYKVFKEVTGLSAGEFARMYK